AVIGTPRYMSPEQLSGRNVDMRSDVFSFGVVVFEMLTGGLPFVGRTDAELMASVMRDEPLLPSNLDSTLPAELDEFVSACLAKSPDVRPANGDALCTLLDELRKKPLRRRSPDPSSKPPDTMPLSRYLRESGRADAPTTASGAAGLASAAPPKPRSSSWLKWAMAGGALGL